jgi:hypothetical protein
VKNTKFFISLILASVLVISQVAVVFAAPTQEGTDPIIGTVQKITLKTNPNTGVTTVLVEVLDENGVSRTVRVSQETALDPKLGLITLDDDGNPLINEDALGLEIVIQPADIIPEEEQEQHPVGSALARFFSDIQDLDYDAIMTAYENGNGFGLIAQALWLTRKLNGNADDFALILQAKKDGDFSSFTFEDGTSPITWGQFRKAVMGEDKKGSLGIVMSQEDRDDHGNGNNGNGNNGNGNNGTGNDNRNNDRSNNGNGNGNGNGHRP